MSTLSRITLKPGKEEGPKRFHPWIFSGAIKSSTSSLKEGDLVEVFSSKEEYLGTGHFQSASISVRLITFNRQTIDQEFWNKKIQAAIDFRKNIGLLGRKDNNVLRLVFGEGDALPGLIIDLYNDTAVLQCHTIGMWYHRKNICEALQNVLGKSLLAVYDKSAETIAKKTTAEIPNGYLFGAKGNSDVVSEYGNQFHIDWEGGQKTGFFIDQRENRKLLASYSQGKTVLNTFCYTGGFSVYAMNAGAVKVDSVDVSEKAMALTKKNMELNNSGFSNAGYFAMDTFDYLDNQGGDYDIIVLDPPAFAKHHDVKHNAIMGYKRLNSEALKKIKSGGLLFTFSCSGVVDKRLFANTIMSAAIVARRKVRIIHQLSQPPCHPVNIYHPEGEYLKGLVLYVE